MYLSLVWPLSLMLALTERKRVLWTLMSVLICAASILTFSRGLWLSASVTLVLVFVTQRGIPRLRRSQIAPLLRIAGVVALLIVLAQRQDALQQIVTERLSSVGEAVLGSDGPYNSRLFLWSVAISALGSSPVSLLLGLGQGTFGDWRAFGIFDADELGREGVLHVHNIFVETLTTTGVIGFTLFMLAIAQAVADAYWAHKRAEGPSQAALAVAGALALGGVLLDGLSLNGLVSPWLWIAFGLNQATTIYLTRGRGEAAPLAPGIDGNSPGVAEVFAAPP
jgi:O-antigen ligase